ncbi:hypothetical protein TOPH_05803 [Tolypocladium ophioglossoides CBS 100239]|uniref:Uncharacterized protein n=1 Tax=Tolypocladium ophioglossoides (strain CBS 100239) TaxID=1163406 RepID=A0A0L0N5W5_TOLOC|nr:hypothetical protein TOPH_05803 [Tolypocladium ophioglossoides CBS 100239]
MADGIAHAVDKVGPPEPTAPEARAGAPTMDGPPFLAVCPPAPPNHQPGKLDHPDGPDRRKENKVSVGAGPAVAAPRPVEIQSVPETPVNGSTPAGGTPRPELKIPEEPAPAKESPKDPVFITGLQEPLSTLTAVPRSEPVSELTVGKAATSSLNGKAKAAETSAPATHTGPAAEPVPAPAPAHMPITDPASIPDPAPAVAPQPAKPAEHAGPLKLNEPAAPPAPSEPSKPAELYDPIVGEKRKFDCAAVAATAKPLTADRAPPPPLPSDKRPKVDDARAETNGGAPAPKAGPGRPKKNKKAAPVVGKTARKTRSQGPVDA